MGGKHGIVFPLVDFGKISQKWGFPEMGVPSTLIGFSIMNPPAIGVSPFQEIPKSQTADPGNVLVEASLLP